MVIPIDHNKDHKTNDTHHIKLQMTIYIHVDFTIQKNQTRKQQHHCVDTKTLYL